MSVAVLMSACSAEVQHDLLEEDANEIYALLHERGFSPIKHREEADASRYAIAVGKADVAKASAVLHRHGLPRVRQPGFSLITANRSIVPTQTEERAIFIQALSGEVANALARLPSVLDARVIVNVPQSDELEQDSVKPVPSAAVYIHFRADSEGATLSVGEDQLKRFVAGAVADLKPENVSVVAVSTVEAPDPGPSGEMLTAELLKAMVGVLSALLLVSAGTLIVLLRRQRHAASAVGIS